MDQIIDHSWESGEYAVLALPKSLARNLVTKRRKPQVPPAGAEQSMVVSAGASVASASSPLRLLPDWRVIALLGGVLLTLGWAGVWIWLGLRLVTTMI